MAACKAPPRARQCGAGRNGAEGSAAPVGDEGEAGRLHLHAGDDIGEAGRLVMVLDPVVATRAVDTVHAIDHAGLHVGRGDEAAPPADGEPDACVAAPVLRPDGPEEQKDRDQHLHDEGAWATAAVASAPHTETQQATRNSTHTHRVARGAWAESHRQKHPDSHCRIFSSQFFLYSAVKCTHVPGTSGSTITGAISADPPGALGAITPGGRRLGKSSDIPGSRLRGWA